MDMRRRVTHAASVPRYRHVVRPLVVLAVAVALIGPASTSADADGPAFHRTTPRAALVDAAGLLVIGIPAGRAWGIEGDLRALPGVDAAIAVRLAVDDDRVREAFVRIAYYASATARTRQLAISDSAPVHPGERRVVAVVLDPPAGAVAYRVRVLARVEEASEASRSDAIVASFETGAAVWPPLLSRLLP